MVESVNLMTGCEGLKKELSIILGAWSDMFVDTSSH